MKFFGASNCRGRADTLKLQSKLSNSAVEQIDLRDYMASKVDCKCVGNEVGVAAQKIAHTTPTFLPMLLHGSRVCLVLSTAKK